MKPIELSLAGLNSFRKAQHIDFEKLCSGGVFGIFGPTGSGKSTILDAITLALYGTVERAANNTQGILNQLENQLSVSFTFELAGTLPVRYRAERAYKRTKDGGLRLSSCRLMKLGEKIEVIADKERDVTGKVVDILGLTHDDFTRAVVLPQGKFSEFLSLKGAERRRMLQRLFHLEKYGDQLIAHLRKHTEETKQQLTTIREQEAVLGDASKEAVERGQEAARRIKKELNHRRSDLAEAEKTLADVRSIRRLQEDRDEKQRAHQALLKKREEMEEKKLCLRLAEAADKIFPYLETLIGAERDCEETRETLERVRKQYERSRQSEKKNREAYEASKKEQEKKEPALLKRKERLIQGLNIQRQLEDQEREIKNATSRLSEIEKEKKRQKQKLACVLDYKERLSESLQKLEEKLYAIEVPSGRRAILRQAMEKKNALNTAETFLREKRKEWAAQHKMWLERREKMERLRKREERMAEKGAYLFQRCQTVYHQAAELGKSIRMARVYVAKKIEKAGKARDAAYRKSLSIDLAVGLKEGDPCPVCGSVHHPRPAAVEEEISTQAIDQEISFYQKADQELVRGQREVSVRLTQIEQQSKTLVQTFPNRLDSAGRAESAAASGETVHFSEWDVSGLQKVVNDLSLSLKEISQDILAIGEALEPLSTEENHMKMKRATLNTELSFYENKKQAIQTEAMERKKEAEAFRRDWPADYPPPEEVTDTYNRMQKADEEAEAIRKQAAKIRERLRESDREMTAGQDESGKLEAKWHEAGGRLAASRKACENYFLQLSKLNLDTDTPIEKQIKKTDQELAQLKERREHGYRNWQETLAAHLKIDKQYSNASDRFTRAEAAKRLAEEKWEKKRSRSAFKRRADVLAAHLSEERRVAFAEAVAGYERETAELASAIREIEKQLNGRMVTDEESDKAERLYGERKQAVQQLSEQFGAAVKALENLEERHALYKKLESERIRTQKAADQFEQLQRALRGNAFVSFVAEEQLEQVCFAASKRLGDLTHSRYAIEVDGAGGFVIRDDGNGGIRRPVTSLSGGETFLTSLALALSLSEQIQLRGSVPLQFFFLDEGFGTLDPDLLDTVLTALEKLHMRRLSIGVISHVPEMRERLPRKLIVDPAEPSGRGSRIRMEVL
ncbi:SMC family ATPase [Sporolactobacillus sp. THM7-7]|nr:SMC family ATPase [Sporolactobacillus sp. THM7-7]